MCFGTRAPARGEPAKRGSPASWPKRSIMSLRALFFLQDISLRQLKLKYVVKDFTAFRTHTCVLAFGIV